MSVQARVKYFNNENHAREYAAGMMGPGEIVNFFEVSDGLKITENTNGQDTDKFSTNGQSFVVVAVNII